MIMYTKIHSQTPGGGWWRVVCYGVVLCLGLVSPVQGASRLPQDLMTEEAKLTASDAAERDGFGRSVALSRDGRTALVGAENAACPAGGDDCGAAYVFIREKGGAWIEQQKLTAADAAPLYNFGHSVALSADGKTALIGAPFAGPPAAACPAFNCGAGYVFVRRGDGSWVEQQKLTGSDAGIGATFGWSVALSAHGKTALIGAVNVACPTGANACGAAYVFVREKSGAWIEQQKLTASDAAVGDEFGSSVTLSADGKTALIGGFVACPAGGDCGAAYVYIREKRGAWIEQQKLTASDAAANAAFGFSVSLSSGGKTALIGAPGDFCPSGDLLCGAAYVFVRRGGSWVERQKLTVSNAAGGGVFGFSVALAAGGRTALIGDRDAECPAVGGECGAAYVFLRKGHSWVEQQKLTASDAEFADFFGSSVALAAGGRTALVGTDNPFCPASPNCGAAYVFRK